MVEVGSKRSFGSEKAHVVGAGRVNSDENDVGFRRSYGEGKTKKNQGHAGKYFSYHDRKCKGSVAALQRSKAAAPPGYGVSGDTGSLDVHVTPCTI
jgi:hypothetical protein